MQVAAGGRWLVVKIANGQCGLRTCNQFTQFRRSLSIIPIILRWFFVGSLVALIFSELPKQIH